MWNLFLPTWDVLYTNENEPQKWSSFIPPPISTFFFSLLCPFLRTSPQATRTSLRSSPSLFSTSTHSNPPPRCRPSLTFFPWISQQKERPKNVRLKQIKTLQFSVQWCRTVTGVGENTKVGVARWRLGSDDWVCSPLPQRIEVRWTPNLFTRLTTRLLIGWVFVNFMNKRWFASGDRLDVEFVPS